MTCALGTFAELLSDVIFSRSDEINGFFRRIDEIAIGEVITHQAKFVSRVGLMVTTDDYVFVEPVRLPRFSGHRHPC